MNLKLTRPLAIFDCETTGVNLSTDKIVELAILKVHPDGRTELKRTYVNPEMPIPAAATAIHKITDEMVANAPTFKQIAKSVFRFLEDSDLCTHNGDEFDIPLMSEEFFRVDIEFPAKGQLSIDTIQIMTVKQPRTLEGALLFYTGEVIENAHAADADVSATFKVLEGQLAMYEDVSAMSVEEINKMCNTRQKVDLCGKFVKNEEGKVVFSFGKYKDQEVKAVFKSDSSYYNWIMKSEFTTNTKNIAKIIYDIVHPKKV